MGLCKKEVLKNTEDTKVVVGRKDLRIEIEIVFASKEEIWHVEPYYSGRNPQSVYDCGDD